jgi:hypothetical protein
MFVNYMHCKFDSIYSLMSKRWEKNCKGGSEWEARKDFMHR